MSDDVERVARALYAENERQACGAVVAVGKLDWMFGLTDAEHGEDRDWKRTADEHRDLARVAIAAYLNLASV